VKARRLEYQAHFLTPLTAARALERSLREIPPLIQTAFETLATDRSGNLETVVHDQVTKFGSSPLTTAAERWMIQMPEHMEKLKQWLREHVLLYMQSLWPLIDDRASGAPEHDDLRALMGDLDALATERFFQSAAIIAERDIPAKTVWEANRAGYRMWRRLVAPDLPQRAEFLTWLDTFPARIELVVAHLRDVIATNGRLCDIDPGNASRDIRAVFAPQRFANRVFEDFVETMLSALPNDGSTTTVRFASEPEDGEHVRFSMTIMTESDDDRGIPIPAVGRDSRVDAVERLRRRLAPVNANVEVRRHPEQGSWQLVFVFGEMWSRT
jgi:hypothetical protein